jgi:hypothetical protein
MNHAERPAAGTAGVTVIGCGYTGRRLLQTLSRRGRDFLGTVRSADSLDRIAFGGRYRRDSRPRRPRRALPPEWFEPRVVVYMAPPPDAGDTDTRLRAFLARLPVAPSTLVYLSTTAVYGDTGGAVVDEDSPAAPASDRGDGAGTRNSPCWTGAARRVRRCASCGSRAFTGQADCRSIACGRARPWCAPRTPARATASTSMISPP